MALFMNDGRPDWPGKTQQLMNLPLVPLQVEPELEDQVPSAQLLHQPLRILVLMLSRRGDVAQGPLTQLAFFRHSGWQV